MTVIDPSTALGQCRLRCADFSDITLLPDSVYLQALVDSSDNVPAASQTCAKYILGILSMRTDRQMGLQLIVKGSQAFHAYKEFLLLTISNPAFMDISPIPQGSSDSVGNTLTQFATEWNKNFYNSTSGQQLAFNADNSPNDGSRTGIFGSASVGWEVI